MKLCDLTVSRTIDASAEAIFDVWMDPNSPGGPWFGSKRLITSPAVDGLFYLAVEHEGRTWPHYGRFLQIDRPHRIEYTWVSEATRGLESVVTITLQPHDGHTELTLRHAGVPDDEEGRKHEQGWAWVLSMVAQRFESRGR